MAQTPKAQTVASGLQHPWAVAFLPEGRFLVTERPGRMRVVEPDGKLQPPLQGLPEVMAGGQGGLLDVITDADFARNRTVYFCFSEPGKGTSNSTALARARLSDDSKRLTDVKVIFSQQPKYSSSLHFGCRIVERRLDGQPDGTLFMTLGDRFSRRDDAQTLNNHHGKVIRVGKDGSVPRDNPFVGQAGARPEIWSYGHRNSQGLAFDPRTGKLWESEHGPRGGDEINLPRRGLNYGWPVVTHGINYSGQPIPEARGKAQPGMEPPHFVFEVSPALSGMAFYTGRPGQPWNDSLFLGALAQRQLIRLQLQGDRVVAEERLLQDLGERIRDVRLGPDGNLYLVTDEDDGKLLRLEPPRG